MAGRRRIAAPGEPRCPAEGCERPAGFATAHEGRGRCRRHGGGSSRPPAPEPREEPRPEPAARVRDPLARRLTGDRPSRAADPLAVLQVVLASARRAGYPFSDAWTIGAEAALSYLSDRAAREWWDTLTATERAWSDAYTRRASRLAGLI